MWKIKNRIEQKLKKFIASLDRYYGLSKISLPLFHAIKEFSLRKGKRVRPTLFIIGYLGFTKKIAVGLYTSALSIELLHDFMLVHDDIIDKSDTRRGKPSMHKRLNNYLTPYKFAKFNGEDLAIIAGDIMYAMGINAFLAIDEEKNRKEKALRELVKAALYTGCGEFIELLDGLKQLEKITKGDIYKIYDYKTAGYTFASPLAIGATLAGATEGEVKKLYQYGIYLGRAFQIKDDILGMFGNEQKIGKSTLTDLREAKRTLLIWHAYRYSNTGGKSYIKRILGKVNAKRKDLIRVRKIIVAAGSLEFAKQEITQAVKQARNLIANSKIKPEYRKLLKDYSQETLSV